ncbi:Eco57I restriction-modification methylase domain-containing protein [Nitrososphaera viennensis]|uniref:Eco57I restriction-modification methylase domain-containing protein n=1 Tax=Nitrososphaera viennensis TaxID=1034015 RepID=UPI0009465FFF|nr:hypothetical protein [Nitrososphaera viennensis]
MNLIIQALGLEPASFHPAPFNFSQKPAPNVWKAFSIETVFPIFKINAPRGKVVDIRSFVGGIQADTYVIIAELDSAVVLCIKRVNKQKGEQPLILPLRTEEDFDRVVNVLRKNNFTSDQLSAHMSISTVVDELKSGAERYFINRGLFSNYFLRERLDKTLSDRKRNIQSESAGFLSKFPYGIPSDFSAVSTVLNALGYRANSNKISGGGNIEYELFSGSNRLTTVVAIAADAENLDVMRSDDRSVPSVQAVAALDRCQWAILTNGRLWRLYSSKVSSASTNYFEVDIDGITDEKDPKLKYFLSLFSANALEPKGSESDLDVIFEEGIQYAKELEDNLRNKVFEKQLFLDLVRAVIKHSPSKKYSEEVLAEGKKRALKLLYRLLFILYAESRNLLPTGDSRYEHISMSKLRERLPSLEKEGNGAQAWQALQNLFKAISSGDPNVNVPQYDGALFEHDKDIDSLEVLNKHLVPALRALTEIDGKGIDYQNLGVRQLGSLYEALLEYTVSQAQTDLVIIKDEILDMSFISDLKGKPERIIERGDIYLTSGGLARKGTGSYYTPDKIVKFLVKKGLEPIFADREKKFVQQLDVWHKTRSEEAAIKSTEVLLDIQVVDPAMGSGHFLVSVVDEITRWIMGILERHPDAPLASEIGKDREEIILEQEKKGIKLDRELLTFNVILKRRVMKRCVFGVDINPLAVELAKLSLWLDSFTIGTPLTFLDHHIRAGDSLIGLWMNNLKTKGQDSTTLDVWTDNVESIGDILQRISYPADLTMDEVKKSKGSYEDFKEKNKPLKVLLDMQAASVIDPELADKLPRNLKLVEDTVRLGNIDKVSWSAPIKKVMEYAEKYRFFHWELEFPDAFSDERRGFDLVVMNPPWDAVKPEDDDFFSQYYPQFRRLRSKPEKEKVKRKLINDASIAKAFRDYTERIERKVSFYKLSGQYVRRGGGDTDMWKLFLERALTLQAKNGTLSMVIPSGIVINEGAKTLRTALLERRIRHLYEFENAKGIFPDVHRSYKFVTLVVDNAEPSQDFPAAFYVHEMAFLDSDIEHDKIVKLSRQFIQLVSPSSFSIPEIKGINEFEIFSKLYNNHPLLSEGIDDGKWTFKFVTEMHRTNAAGLFEQLGRGWQLFEGKCFHQFILNYEKPTLSVSSVKGLEWTSKIREYGRFNKEIHQVPRLVFRDVAASTNVRGMIACIIPKHTFVANTAPVIIPRYNGELLLEGEYLKTIAYLAGIFNSTTFDFLIRRRITMHLNFFYIEQTPVPSRKNNALVNEIVKISAELSSPDERFAELAKTARSGYGSVDIKKRIELTAKLDALVAYHYGLSRQEYEYILSTFTGFEEDDKLKDITEVKWDDTLIRKFNGEVRKRALGYFDATDKGEN